MKRIIRVAVEFDVVVIDDGECTSDVCSHADDGMECLLEEATNTVNEMLDVFRYDTGLTKDNNRGDVCYIGSTSEPSPRKMK